MEPNGVDEDENEDEENRKSMPSSVVAAPRKASMHEPNDFWHASPAFVRQVTPREFIYAAGKGIRKCRDCEHFRDRCGPG